MLSPGLPPILPFELKQLVLNYINSNNYSLILDLVCCYNNYIKDRGFNSKADVINLALCNTINQQSKYFRFKMASFIEFRGSEALTVAFYQLCFTKPIILTNAITKDCIRYILTKVDSNLGNSINKIIKDYNIKF